MADVVVFPRPIESRVERYQTAAKPLQVVYPQSDEEALQEIQFARAFVGKITPDLLECAERLEWVQALTASLEHYVFPALVEHRCQLSNVAGIFGDVIAEHVLGYVLSFTRHLHAYRDRQKDRRYEPVGAQILVPDFVGGPQNVTGVDLAHKRVCDHRYLIVGYGGIGQQIAATLRNLNGMVDAVDPRCDLFACQDNAVRVFPPSDLEDRVAGYDFVIVAAPHTPDTEGLFDRDLMSRMKTGAVLINVGRGAIVQTDALVEALDSGQLGGAALDVLEVEPLASESPLWGMPNVLLTPHVAACCDVLSGRQGEVIVENLRRFAAGATPKNIVSKSHWF